MATRKAADKPLIKAATIATALDKVTGKILGFAVKSNSSNQYYQIQTMTFEDGSREFFCDCEAHLWGCAECCHIKAVKEVLVAKAEMAAEEAERALMAYATFEAVKVEVAMITAPAQPVETEQGVTATGKFHPGMFTGSFGRSCHVYISDAEMAKLKAEVAEEKAVREAEVLEFGQTVTVSRAPVFAAPTFVNRENYALTSNAGFSLLKR